MQFVFSPVIGMLSDRYGRRPVILLANFGLGLDYIVMAMAPTLGWLFVGRVISGITGASIMGITGMIGPALFTQTFAKFIDGRGIQLPGAPYYLGAILCSFALLLAWRVTRIEPAATT